jgi:hypothetical protein
MKLLTSAAFGAAALAIALIGSVQPAAARTSFGVYVGGPGYYGYDRGYGYRCDDYWFRRAHPRYCGYGYDYDDDYYPGAYYDDGYYAPGFGFSFFGDGRHHHHHDFDHHWGGERGEHHHWHR